MSIFSRPWGTYENLLESDLCKVKKIVIKPGENPSYQMHEKRSETWTIISGEGIARVNDVETRMTPEMTIFIPVGSKHSIKNTSEKEDLIFIEIQTGTYFGEDDIKRFEDKYGRV